MSTGSIIAVGTRGDTEPLIALAAALVKDSTFSRVHLIIQPDYANLSPNDPGIIVHYLPFSVRDFTRIYFFEYFKSSIVRFFTRRFDLMLFQRHCLNSIENSLVVPALPMVYDILKEAKPTSIISTWLAGSAAASIAEKLNISLFRCDFQPRTPTGAYPDFLASLALAHRAGTEAAMFSKRPEQVLCDAGNLTSYDVQDGSDQLSLRRINKFRAKAELNPLLPADLRDTRFGRRKGIYVMHAYSEDLLPPSPDWMGNIYQVSALADDFLPKDWDASEQCPRICEYLERNASTKPLLVSFGSMYRGNQDSVLKSILEGLYASQAKIVIFLTSGASEGRERLKLDIGVEEWIAKNVLLTKESPQFAWLLPQCRGVVCHGGAGSIFAALRAGLPVLVVPVIFDQFFWGQLLQERGLGAMVGQTLREMEAGTFEKALCEAFSEETYQRARALGEVIRQRGSGCERAVQLIASLV